MNAKSYSVIGFALLTVPGVSRLRADESSHARITVDAQQEAVPPPLIFTAAADETLALHPQSIDGLTQLTVTVQQGKPTILEVAWNGEGQITAVSGARLASWSAGRDTTSGQTRLEIRPVIRPDSGGDYLFTIATRQTLSSFRGSVNLFLPVRGSAADFNWQGSLDADRAITFTAEDGPGMISSGNRHSVHGRPSLTVTFAPAISSVRFSDARLTGSAPRDKSALLVHFIATAEVAIAGARVPFLAGPAAPSERAAGDGWHLEREIPHERADFDLVFDRTGVCVLDIPIAARWPMGVDAEGPLFWLPVPAIVRLQIGGLDPGTSVPDVLPADGAVQWTWRPPIETAPSEPLAFSSAESTRVTATAEGLLQRIRVDLRVFQGTAPSVAFDLSGDGEVVDVSGSGVDSWSVEAKTLRVKFSRPVSENVWLAIRAQTPVPALPATIDPLRLTPIGTLQHAGIIALGGSGNLQAEIVRPVGLEQESDGRSAEYRFSSSERQYSVRLSSIQPETDVSVIATDELSPSIRTIRAGIELDVRRAGLQEWSFLAPADYALIQLEGADVSDSRTETEGAYQKITAVFRRQTVGRTLLHVQLEKIQPPVPGSWDVPTLRFPGAASVRGQLGLVASAGFRLTAAQGRGLTETPLSRFPEPPPGLQLAYRLSSGDWAATAAVSAVPRTVQADVFHLYAVRAGRVGADVLVNYFVTGAPSSAWRIHVPSGIANLQVTGESVRRDWKVDDGVLTVPLNRPVLGAAAVLISFDRELRRSNAESPSEIEPGEVQPLDVDGERGYAEVTAVGAQKLSRVKIEGSAFSLTPQELPPEYRSLSSESPLGAFEYTGRPFKLAIEAQTDLAAARVSQVVDYAEFTSDLAPDGAAVTTAVLQVASNSSPWLRCALPAAVTMWDCRVDDEAVTPRVDDGGTLIPIPNSKARSRSRIIRLSFDQKGSEGRLIQGPRLFAPIAFVKWTVRATEGRGLAAQAGEMAIVSGQLPTSATVQFQRTVWPAAGLVLSLFVGCIAQRRAALGWIPTAAVAALAALICGARFCSVASEAAAQIPSGVIFAGQSVLAGHSLSADVHATSAARLLAPARITAGVAMALACGLAIWVLLRVGVIASAQIRRGWLRRSAVSGGALLLAAMAVGASHARADEPGPRVESIVQTWMLRGGWLHAEMDWTGQGQPGQEVTFLNRPGVLTAFSGDGVASGARDQKSGSYALEFQRSGPVSAHIRYEEPADDIESGLPVVTPAAAVQRISIQMDQAGWSFRSRRAVAILPGQGPNGTSSAVLILGPGSDPEVTAVPKPRDRSAEVTRLSGSSAILYLPSSGAVHAVARAIVRPVTGLWSALDIGIPDGFVVSDVQASDLRQWRYSPAQHVLHLTLATAREDALAITIQMQKPAAELPFRLQLAPIDLRSTEAETLVVGIAASAEVQPERLEASDALRLDDEGVLAELKSALPSATTLTGAFKCANRRSRIAVTAAAVEPVIRAETRNLLSLDDERITAAIDLAVSVTRAGIFALHFDVPDGMEIDSVSSPDIDHWSAVDEHGAQVVAVHFSRRFTGSANLAVTLSGAAPAIGREWTLPQIRLEEANEQKGDLDVVPAAGLALQVTQRVDCLDAEADPGDEGAAGSLHFRLLQKDASLRLIPTALPAWVTAECLLDRTEREGETATRMSVRFHVENSPIRSIRFELPGLTAAEAQSVRASGLAVNDCVPVAGKKNTWEVRFLRRVIGDASVIVDFLRTGAAAHANRTIEVPRFAPVGDVRQFVALRAAGQMQISLPDSSAGWEKGDWRGLPVALADPAKSAAPDVLFRRVLNEGTLTYQVHRRLAATVLKAEVSQIDGIGAIGSDGGSFQSWNLALALRDKVSVHFTLPAGGRLCSVRVNDEAVAAVQDGSSIRVTLAPARPGDQSARLQVVFIQPPGAAGRFRLQAPQWDLPLRNVTWEVSLPPGYRMDTYRGSLTWQGETANDLPDYATGMEADRAAEAEATSRAQAAFQEAGQMALNGNQDQATVLLRRLSNLTTLDGAADEDARVELRALRTQQTMLAVNARLQRLYLANTAGADRDPQLAAAAAADPLLQGTGNFNPQNLGELTMGNTEAKNSALQAIAARLVERELAADSIADSLDVRIPRGERQERFTQSVALDEERPLQVELRLSTELE